MPMFPKIPRLAPSPAMHARRSLADLLLTQQPKLRFALAMWLISLCTYLLYSGILLYQVHLGFVRPTPAALCIAGALLANFGFYVAMRSGWSARLGGNQLGLGNAQLATGMVFMWANYAIVGPASGSTLIILASHMVYALFNLSARRVAVLAAVSLAGLALTMWLAHVLDPARYDPDLQIVGWLYACLVIPLIALLAQRVARMNDAIRTQSQKLADALARVQELATRDDLTRLYNRRHMMELMEMQLAQRERSSAPLCIALLDIDHFKRVNDLHGHHTGDEVLRRFAAETSGAMRSSDLVARWGGEEFIVMFPATPMAQAQTALLRLESRLLGANFNDLAADLRITFSAGLIEVRHGEALQACIERADRAMYRAKAAGRNRVDFADSSLLAQALPEPLPAAAPEPA